MSHLCHLLGACIAQSFQQRSFDIAFKMTHTARNRRMREDSSPHLTRSAALRHHLLWLLQKPSCSTRSLRAELPGVYKQTTECHT